VRMDPLLRLSPFDDESGDLNVIIDTPRGSRNKFGFDLKEQTYVLKGVLPNGAVFPFDFGSIAGTNADDGDPLDALVLMDEAAFCGCLVRARLIGVIEAEQTEKGKTERNDRLIAVASKSHTHGRLKSLKDVDSVLLDEIEHFFISYNDARGKKFKPLGRFGPSRARKLVKRAQARAKR
jgi:inorganic pyrophosphatase